MKRLLISGLAGLALVARMQAGPAPSYVIPLGTTLNYTNNGTVFNPVIDAVNFINYGTFNSITFPLPLPFETFDTLNYTNYGTISGINGWRFDFASNATGRREMAANFVSPGTVEAIDPPSVGLNTLGVCAVSTVDPSYLFISATNITMRSGALSTAGSLTVGANGLMDLEGSRVDLSYSGVEALPVWDEAQGTLITSPPTNFIPDIGIYDLYWVQSNFNDTTYPLISGFLWDGTTARAQPVFNPPTPTQPVGYPGFSLTYPEAGSYILAELTQIQLTNSSGQAVMANILSNVTKGAVFVGVPNGFNVQMGFGAFPTVPFNNPYLSIGVLLTTTLTNSLTGQPEGASIGFEDQLASDSTVRGLSANILYCSSPPTFRPANYLIQRASLGVGFSGNSGYPEPNFFLDSGQFDTNVVSDTVTNDFVAGGDYAGYGCSLDNLASRVSAVVGGAVTNLPGRIYISADALDLTQTRIRSQGFIQINTPHLISSSNAIIDCENLSFNIGSTNGNLKIRNLVPGAVTPRLRGFIRAWSAVWSNSVTVELSNYAADTNVPPNYLPANLTNTYTVNYDTLMLDARSLSVLVPVNVFDLTTHCPNVVVDDSMSVIQSLLIDGRSLTLNGDITIPGVYPPNPLTGFVPPIQPLLNWNAANAPNVLYFTNNGALSVVNEAHFGDDRPPYATFVNNGSIVAAGISLNSYYFQSAGTLSSQGALFVAGNTGKLQNGSASSGTISQFTCNSLKLNNYQLSTGNGALNFYVTNALSDAGPGSANTFQVQQGFNLWVKPQVGDLLGTTLKTIAPAAANGVPNLITHYWAGEDRGPTPAGYLNNVAVGTLAFLAPNPSSRLSLYGTGTKNGLYADLLDLSGMPTNFLNQIAINPNLTLYFAAAKMPNGFVLPITNNVQMEAEEYLDGQLGGHLRWVRDYAGANSSVAVIINGQSMQVNKALRNSLIIDSDGNGTANGLQAQPFIGIPMVVQIHGNGTVTPDYNGQTLLQGLPYSMTATPADGFVFSGWTGSITSSSPTLNFVVTNGASYTANFSFVLSPGSYGGLFYESEPVGVEYLRSGAISVTTTKGGRFSGSLQTAAQRYSFSGQLNANGADTIAVPGSTLTLQLQVGSNTITGTVQNGANWTANIQGDRAAFNTRAKTPAFAGKYTILFPGTGDPTDATDPQGTGYGYVTVDASGKVKISASLADGVKVTQMATASGAGQWPLFVPLYNGRGQILGWQTFASTPEQDLGGQFSWIRQTNAVGKIYPNGFIYEANAAGSAYNPASVPLPGFANGTLLLSGGNLADDITNSFSVDAKSKVTVSGGRQQSLKFNASQGVFSGSVTDPNTGKPVKFNGALFQKLSSGSGYFLGTNQSGSVSLGQ